MPGVSCFFNAIVWYLRFISLLFTSLGFGGASGKAVFSAGKLFVFLGRERVCIMPKSTRGAGTVVETKFCHICHQLKITRYYKNARRLEKGNPLD